jgi:CDP-paratose 2-epimerase
MATERSIGKKINYAYFDQNRVGDHICCITNPAELKRRYPNWSITKSLDEIICEMIKEEIERNGLSVPEDGLGASFPIE